MSAMEMKKGEFQAYIKKYMVKLKTHLQENKPDRVDGFMAAAKAVIGMLLGKLEDVEFFQTNEDPACEGHIGIAYWKDPESDTAPTFINFVDGLKGEKY